MGQLIDLLNLGNMDKTKSPHLLTYWVIYWVILWASIATAGPFKKNKPSCEDGLNDTVYQGSVELATVPFAQNPESALIRLSLQTPESPKSNDSRKNEIGIYVDRRFLVEKGKWLLQAGVSELAISTSELTPIESAPTIRAFWQHGLVPRGSPIYSYVGTHPLWPLAESPRSDDYSEYVDTIIGRQFDLDLSLKSLAQSRRSRADRVVVTRKVADWLPPLIDRVAGGLNQLADGTLLRIEKKPTRKGQSLNLNEGPFLVIEGPDPQSPLILARLVAMDHTQQKLLEIRNYGMTGKQLLGSLLYQPKVNYDDSPDTIGLFRLAGVMDQVFFDGHDSIGLENFATHELRLENAVYAELFKRLGAVEQYKKFGKLAQKKELKVRNDDFRVRLVTSEQFKDHDGKIVLNVQGLGWLLVIEERVGSSVKHILRWNELCQGRLSGWAFSDIQSGYVGKISVNADGKAEELPLPAYIDAILEDLSVLSSELK